jgi:hypothetical protein
MTRGGYGLPKVSPGCAMPYLSMPCGRAILEPAVSGVARSQSGQPAAIFYPLGHDTPYAYVPSPKDDPSDLGIHLMST